MKEQLVTFKVAKLAKDNKFFIRCKKYYPTENPFSSKSKSPPIDHLPELDNLIGEEFTEKYASQNSHLNLVDLLKYQVDTYIECPTQEVLRRWLREKHHIHISIEYIGYLKIYQFKCEDWRGRKHTPITFQSYSLQFLNYEDALREGLVRSLNLI